MCKGAVSALACRHPHSRTGAPSHPLSVCACSSLERSAHTRGVSMHRMEAVADWQQRAGTPQSGMLRTPGHRSAPSLSFSGASLSALKTANAAHVIEQQLRQIESLKHLAVTKGATSQMVELAMKRRQPLDRQRYRNRLPHLPCRATSAHTGFSLQHAPLRLGAAEVAIGGDGGSGDAEAERTTGASMCFFVTITPVSSTHMSYIGVT